MPVYTVHVRAASSAAVAPTDRFAFVRDGFHFWAFLLGPVWLRPGATGRHSRWPWWS